MYKAIKKIGGYGVGDIVPDREAELWLEMYKVPQVEEIPDEPVEKPTIKEEPEKVPEEKEKKLDVLLEDYLGRNQSVVKKNVLGDKLSKQQLDGLLSLESSDKKRPLVIEAIQKRLEDF